MFGSKLSDVCRRDTDNLNVPLFVKECIDAIEKRGMIRNTMMIKVYKIFFLYIIGTMKSFVVAITFYKLLKFVLFNLIVVNMGLINSIAC